MEGGTGVRFYCAERRGPAVFVHITAFANRGNHPADNDIVAFSLSTNGKGQQRAENVAYVRDRSRRQSSSFTEIISLFVAALFLVVVTVFAIVGKLPTVMHQICF